jgi:hypothetical protein
MKALDALPMRPRMAADRSGALDTGATLSGFSSLSGAESAQAVTDSLGCSWQERSRGEDEITHLLKQRSLQSIDLLIKWMVSRRIRAVEAAATTLHPSFRPQWIQATMTEECSDLVYELGDGMPAWRIASWFCSPNPRLFALSPSNLLPCDWHVVVDAARLDKFDATGESNLRSTEAARRAPSGGCGDLVDRKQTQVVNREGLAMSARSMKHPAGKFRIRP